MTPSAKREEAERGKVEGRLAVPNHLGDETAGDGPHREAVTLKPVASTKPPSRGTSPSTGTRSGAGVDVAPQRRAIPSGGSDGSRRWSSPGSSHLRGIGRRLETASTRAAAGAPPSRAAARPGSPAAADPTWKANSALFFRVRQEEAQLAQRVERDVVIEGAAQAMVKLPVATLAERQPGAQTAHALTAGAGVVRGDRAAHPALWEVEAEGSAPGRADHGPPRTPRRRADLAVLRDDAADGARPRAHALYRALQMEARPVRDGGPRDASVVFSGSAWPAPGVCMPPPSRRRAGDDAPRSRARSRRVGRRTRARPAATLEAGHAAVLAASARLPPWIHSMSAPSSRGRPRQRRCASITSGISTGSRPCWRTKPQSFATARRARARARPRRHARHAGRGKYASGAADRYRPPTTTTSASRSIDRRHRRPKAGRVKRGRSGGRRCKAGTGTCSDASAAALELLVLKRARGGRGNNDARVGMRSSNGPGLICGHGNSIEDEARCLKSARSRRSQWRAGIFTGASPPRFCL